jgi:hypothetical protein
MPIIKPAIDFPPPPIDVFPHAAIDRPWVKARFDRPYPYAPPLFDKVKGWLRDDTRQGVRRRYLFEVIFVGGVARPTVSPCDPSRDDLNDSFSYRDDTGRKIAGFPKSARKDLHKRATDAARDMRERALAQQQWLDDLFETAQRADVVDIDTRKPPDGPPREFAVHRDWLITRRDYPGGKWTYADRFFEGCADGLTLRRAGAVP